MVYVDIMNNAACSLVGAFVFAVAPMAQADTMRAFPVTILTETDESITGHITYGLIARSALNAGESIIIFEAGSDKISCPTIEVEIPITGLSATFTYTQKQLAQSWDELQLRRCAILNPTP